MEGSRGRVEALAKRLESAAKYNQAISDKKLRLRRTIEHCCATELPFAVLDFGKEIAMNPLGPSVQPWPQDQELSPNAVETRMKAEGLPYYRWSNGPGDVYSAHVHNYHKVIYVVQGSITFGLPETGTQMTLSAGDRLDLPAGITHNAVVGSQGVVCLEGHRKA